MVNYSLRDLGYNYVILDDCWQDSPGRNASGYLQANPSTFPHGMKYVADVIHSMGMKFGMYSSAGIYTCAKYAGSLDNEMKDAEYFAEVGVDYLKYDNCYNQGRSGTPLISFERYDAMSKALNSTGREIVYSMCNWGNDNPFDWAYTIANSARMSGDIYDAFNRPDSGCPCEANPCDWPGQHCSVMNILNKMAPTYSRTQTGFWLDMDTMEIGNGGMDDNEYVTHMSMWSLMSSPLIIGTDLRSLTSANLAIYSNPAVIALNQDPSGMAAYRVWRYTCTDVDRYGQCEYALWVKSLENGDQAVALLNAANSSMTMNASLYDIFLSDSLSGTSMPASQLGQAWDVFDLWANRMSDREAHNVLNGTAGPVTMSSNSTTRYNATEKSYADGLMANATALMGRKIGTVAPHGTLTADVARHSVGLFRLRLVMGDGHVRDEL